MGGATVIVSEPQPERAALALKMGADYVIDPTKVDFTEEVLRLTGGMGASLYLEATGLPTAVYPGIEQCIWEGRTLNATGRGRGARRGQDARHRRSAAGAPRAHRGFAGPQRPRHVPRA